MRVCVCVFVCVHVCARQLSAGLLTNHQHTPSRAPSAAHTNTRRTHSPPHNKHDPIARNAAATQRRPPRPATCQTYTLTCPTPRSHHHNYNYYQAATRVSTTRTSTTRPATTRTPPARGSAQPVKHPSNTRERSQSSKKARQLTAWVQADVRQSRQIHAATTRRRVVAVPVVVPARRAGEPQQPKPPTHQSAI